MNKRLEALLAKSNALSPRERMILFVLLLAAVWALMDALLLSPQSRARATESARIESALERMRVAQDALAQRESQLPPDLAAIKRLEAARTAFNARMAEAGRLRDRLVAPKDMPVMLRDLTRDQPGLRLVSLHTLPPEAVGARAEPPSPTDAAPQQGGGLFKHGVSVTLAGSYEGLVRYMSRLEKLPVNFYWARAELDASTHPEVRLTLTLNTLSLERQWLIL